MEAAGVRVWLVTELAIPRLEDFDIFLTAVEVLIENDVAVVF